EAWYPVAVSGVQPQPELPLHVLYEDGWLLVVAKPAGQLSHPARSEQRGTVANVVAARFRIATGEGPELVRPLHRLDRDTSGLLLFARDAATARALARQRSTGELTRDYLALVDGRPPPCGEIDAPLGPDPLHRTRRQAGQASLADPASQAGHQGQASLAEQPSREDQQVPPIPDDRDDSAPGLEAWPGFQEAHTSYRVVQYGARATLIAARLHTGRTHQVRAHLAAIGHPLLGDDLYGGPPRPGLQRQALHAWRTRLRHPAGGTHLTLIAPLPEDLRTAAGRAIRELEAQDLGVYPED
ncbi:MAG: RluA family pseudouridine synthase, partial [Chloroflexota bacterium]|nr:RluA family pseudouridine synthase [Chloroflexota bacterium]